MHSEGNTFSPTLQFRKEPKDLPKAHGYWRYLFHLAKYESGVGEESLLQSSWCNNGLSATATNSSCYQIFKVKSSTGIFFIQRTLNKHFKIIRLQSS